MGGAAVTQVFVGDRSYDVSVRYPLNSRYDPEALGNLTLTNSSGMQIPLSQVAKIAQRTGEGTITRTDTTAATSAFASTWPTATWSPISTK